MSDKTVELKSCPFCGGKLKTINNIYGKCTNKKCFLGGTKTMEQSHDNTVEQAFKKWDSKHQNCNDIKCPAETCSECAFIAGDANGYNRCKKEKCDTADKMGSYKIGKDIGYREAIKEVHEWVCSECEYNNGKCFEDSQMSGYCYQYDLLSKLSKMREGE